MAPFSAPAFPFDPCFGQPEDILHSGDIYGKVAMKIEDLDGYEFATVVALTGCNDEYAMEDGPTDVECAGPPLLVFNRAVYSKSWSDTAYVSDEMIRTVFTPQNHANNYLLAASPAQVTHQPNFLQPPGRVLTPPPATPAIAAPPHSVAPVPAPTPVPISASSIRPPIRSSTTSMNTAYLAGWLAARSTRAYGGSVVQAQATAPPVPTRVMPARASIRNNKTLTYGFDLAPTARAATSFLPPLSHNYYLNSAGQQELHTNLTRPSRMPWEDNHKVYVWELVLLAMLQLNRPVERRDFLAITEALHRQFSGTTNAAGVQYPLRGFNTVHSMVTKHPGWEDFVRYFLPGA